MCLLTHSAYSLVRVYIESVVVRTPTHIKSSSHKSLPLKLLTRLCFSTGESKLSTVLYIYKHCTNLKLYFAHWNFFNNVTYMYMYLLSGKILVKAIRNLNQDEINF